MAHDPFVTSFRCSSVCLNPKGKHYEGTPGLNAESREIPRVVSFIYLPHSTCILKPHMMQADETMASDLRTGTPHAFTARNSHKQTTPLFTLNHTTSPAHSAARVGQRFTVQGLPRIKIKTEE